MNTTRFAVLFGRTLGLLLCLAALPGFAADPVDGPKARFDDPFIDRLAGCWDITREIRGTPVRNAMAASWVLNHQFLQVHMKDVKDPPAYEALVLVGFVHATKQYVAHWTDTWGGKFSAVGRGQREGDAITFRFEYPDGPFFNTFAWEEGRQGWTFRLETQDAKGERRRFATDTAKPVPCPDPARPSLPSLR